jgi:hypothetical protein
MNLETKQCQNCKQNFVIEPEDFEFYAKIKVPVPTFCPERRFIRKAIFRNKRSLYKRKCDALDYDESLISIYSPENSVVVYDQKYWWSDEWDAMHYSKVLLMPPPSRILFIASIAISKKSHRKQPFCVMRRRIWRFWGSLFLVFFALAGKADLHSRPKSPTAVGHYAFGPPRALKNQIPLRFFKTAICVCLKHLRFFLIRIGLAR